MKVDLLEMTNILLRKKHGLLFRIGLKKKSGDFLGLGAITATPLNRG